MEKYYLSSMESYQLSFVRECMYDKKISFDTGKEAVIASIDNPVQWQDSKGFHGSDKIILTARHEGYGIFEISCFPTFVYVSVLKEKDYDFIEEVKKEDLYVVGIGELYQTNEDAINHRIDKN